jgi:GABA(A) receptor-associated protein
VKINASAADFERKWYERTEEARRDISVRQRDKHANSVVPVLLFRAKKTKRTDMQVTKHTFLVNVDQTFGKFVCMLRSKKRKDGTEKLPWMRMESDPSLGLYYTVGKNTMPRHTATVGELFREHQSDDGFLYVRFDAESTFGSE